MSGGRAAGHDAVMSTDVSLHAAATVLHDAATAGSSPEPRHDHVTALPAELEEIVAALRVVADAVDRAAQQIAPPVEGTYRVSDRYRMAVASWPTTPAPSYERLAGLLATLHEASAAVRGAARTCDGADVALRAALGRDGRPFAARPMLPRRRAPGRNGR